MTKETGGPAFPIFPETGAGHAAAHQGLTIRDYFAAQALSNQYTHNSSNAAVIAQWAYVVADAMLEARK